MRITLKIGLIFVTLAIIITSLTVSVQYFIAKDIIEKGIFDRLVACAESRSDELALYIDMLKISATQLSKSVIIENFLKISKNDPNRAEAFKNTMSRLSRTKDVSSFIAGYSVLDISGRVVASTDPASIGEDNSNDSYFTGGQKGIYIKDAYHSKAENMGLMGVSAPITDSMTGTVIGVLIAHVKLSMLYSITLDRMGLGDSGEVFIVNKYGFMITPSRFIKDTFLKKRVDTESVRRGMEHRNSKPEKYVLLSFRDYRGVQVLATHAYLPEMQWVVCVEIDIEEAYRPLRKILFSTLALLILASLLAISAGRILAAMITQPIHKLRREVRIIGSGNLDYKIGSYSNDEIGQLSRAFDEMTSDLKDKIISIDSLNTEIVMRKQAQRKLEQSERKFKTIFESSRDAIMIVGPAGVFVDANTAAIELFGCKNKEQFTLMTPADLSPVRQPDGRLSTVKSQEMMAIAMEKGRNFFDWTHKRMGGEEFYANVLLNPIEINGQRLLQATVRDITNSKLAEAKVAESVAVKERFISTVSHELRTPMTAIKEGIDIVLDGSAGAINDDQKEFLALAARNINRLIRLINDILDYQKLEAEKTVFHMKMAGMNEVVKVAIKTMMPLAKSRGLYLEAELAPELPETLFDEDRILQVLINLVNNAIKFTTQGGIKLATSQDKECILVSVKDTGAGVKKEDIPKLFRGFSQVEYDKAPSSGSTGLGLAISKKIIQEHGGSMWVESLPGKWSDFKFTLPLKKKYKILLADQEPDARIIYKLALESSGYEVTCLEKNVDAVALAQKDKPDIIILNMKLSDINSYEEIIRLKNSKGVTEIPIIAMSVHTEELYKLKEDSSLVLIGKPFKFEDLLAKIRRLLKQQA